jgi:P-type conjugative transfer protein TrbJ
VKKILLAGAAALALALTTPGDAQVVYCSNCSTVSQQLLDYARQFQQLTNEIQTTQNTLNTYINLVQNTVNLPSTVYRDLTADINRITSIANQANMLAGQTKLMLTNLSSTSGYPLGNISNWHQELSNESAAISGALTTAANTLNLQQTQMNTDSASLASLQTQALGTSGRQMTLQTLAGALSTIGQLVQKQQATVTTAYQAMMTKQTGDQDWKYMIWGVNDRDTETTWVNECSAIAALGTTPGPQCAGY